MTKRSQLTLLLIALVLALLSTSVIVKQLNTWQKSHEGQNTVGVVRVTKSIPAHTVVLSSDVAVQQVPAAAVEAGAVTQLSDVVGLYTTSDWYVGQQVISPMVVQKNQVQSFPLQIPTGNRAFTIADDAIVGVDHLVSNGDHVDLVATYASKDLGGPISKVILQNILVLNVDSSPQTTSSTTSNTGGSVAQQSASSAGGSHVDTITLSVTPDEATLLDYAVTFGDVHIMLRNPVDTEASSVAAVSSVGAGH